jgi:hypothetical protein
MLEVQFFRPDGAPQTAPTILMQAPATLYSAGIGTLGDRYFLAWKNDRSTLAQFYSNEGQPIGAPLRWPYSDIPYFLSYYRFGSAPLWRFLPITYQLKGYDFGGDPIYNTFLRVAAPDGTLLGLPVEQNSLLDAAINGSGRLVVVSLECPPSGGACQQGLQIFDGALRPQTPFVTAGVPQLGSSHGTTALSSIARPAMSPNGQIMLTWIHRPDDAFKQWMARLYDSEGVPLSDALQVSPPLQYTTGVANPIPLTDGSFILSWLVAAPVGLKETFFVERFDPRSMTFDPPVAVLADVNANGVLLQLNGQGRGAIVWQSLAAGASPTVGHFRVVSLIP